MNKSTFDFFGHIKIFLVSIGISWPFLLGAVTGATDFGLKLSVVRTPITYALISIISIIIGVVAVLIEHKRSNEKVFETFRTFPKYVKACKEIHRNHSRVMILAKTPGLILPTERDLHSDRRDYFEIINKKIEEGRSSYQLDYFFDIDGYKTVLKEYLVRNEQQKIEQARNMVKKALTYDNLDLRYVKTETLASAIIGSDVVMCMGFREKETKKIAEGIRIHGEELVRVLKPQYDLLFNKSIKVDENFFDETLSSIKNDDESK